MDIAGQGPAATGLTGTTLRNTQPLTFTARAVGVTLITVILDYDMPGYGPVTDAISFYVTVSAFNNPPTTSPTIGTPIQEGVRSAYFDVLANCDDVEKPVNLKIMEILPAGSVTQVNPGNGSPTSLVYDKDHINHTKPYLGYNATVSIAEYQGKQQIHYEVIGANYAQLYWNGTDVIYYRIEDGGGASAIGILEVKRLPMDNAPIIYHRVFYVDNDGSGSNAGAGGSVNADSA
jgi:hypothetical protein